MVRILKLNPDQTYLLYYTPGQLPNAYIAVGPVDDYDAYTNIDLDSFSQGGVYDDAGNKGVYSRRIEGDLVLPPTDDSMVVPSTLRCWPSCTFDGSPTKYSTYYGKLPILAFVPIAASSATVYTFQDKRRYWEYPGYGQPKYECEQNLKLKLEIEVRGVMLCLKWDIISVNSYVDGRAAPSRYIIGGSARSRVDRYRHAPSWAYGYWQNASETTFVRYGDGRQSQTTRDVSGSFQLFCTHIMVQSIEPSAISPSVWTQFLGPNLDFSIEKNEWEQLGYDAINSADYTDMNLVALAGDISDLPNFVKSLIEDGVKVAKNAAKWSENAKDRAKAAEFANSASGFYLENIYGLNLTIPDTQSFFGIFNRAIDEASKSCRFVKKLRSRTEYDVNVHGFQLPCTLSYMARVRLRGNNISERLASCMNELYKWDAFGWDNLWDLVPFSFVIDWFVKFGDLLADVDAWSKSRYYDLLSVTKSVKFDAVPLPAANVIACRNALGDVVELEGQCALTWYRRWGEFEFPSFPTADNLQFGDPSKLWGHWKEATALVIQKLT